MLIFVIVNAIVIACCVVFGTIWNGSMPLGLSIPLFWVLGGLVLFLEVRLFEEGKFNWKTLSVCIVSGLIGLFVVLFIFDDILDLDDD